MNRSQQWLLGGGLAMAALLAGSAMAGNNYNVNRKLMSGAQCQPSWGDQWADFIINPEGLRNTSTTLNRYVSCALVIDADADIDQADNSTTTSAGGLTIQVFLDYSAISPTKTVTTDCTVIRYDFDGTRTTAAFSVVGIGGPGSRYQTTSPAMLTGASPFNPDTVSMNCRLPPLVRLTAVKTYEYMDTGGYSYTP